MALYIISILYWSSSLHHFIGVLHTTGFHWSPIITFYQIMNQNQPARWIDVLTEAWWLWIVCYLATRTHTHRSKYKYLKRAASQMALLICGGLCDSGVGFTSILYVPINNMSKPGPWVCSAWYALCRIVSQLLMCRSMADPGIGLPTLSRVCVFRFLNHQPLQINGILSLKITLYDAFVSTSTCTKFGDPAVWT